MLGKKNKQKQNMLVKTTQPAPVSNYQKQWDLINLYITKVAQVSYLHHNSFQVGTLTKPLDSQYQHSTAVTASSPPQSR